MIKAFSKIQHKWAYLALFAACMCLWAETAFADMTLLDAISAGPAGLFNFLFIPMMVSLIQDILTPFLAVMLDWGSDWFDIPYVNTIILWLQGLAVIAAVIVRVYVGIRSGIFQDGGSREYTIEEYFGKSVLAIILVGVMPTLCRLIILFGESVFKYVVANTGGVQQGMAWLDFSGVDANAMAEVDDFASLWLILLALIIVIFAIACGYQFIRRQVEMLTVCIIAPIVSVYAATEESTNQVGDLLRSLLGLVLQQFLQYMLVLIALNFGNLWIQSSFGSIMGAGSFDFAGTGVQQFMFCIATFMGALTIPRLVDRYTFGSGGSRLGGVAASQAIMTARLMLMRR